MLKRKRQGRQSLAAACWNVKAEDPWCLGRRAAARCQDRRAMTVDHAARFRPEEVVKISAQHWSEFGRWGQPPPCVRLAAVVEPLCCQKIRVDETGKDHSCEKPVTFSLVRRTKSVSSVAIAAGSGRRIRPHHRSCPRGIWVLSSRLSSPRSSALPPSGKPA